MPTTPRRARKLLQNQRAKVVHLNPFTIRLLQPSSEWTQPLVLGLDMGSQTIGYSVVLDGKKSTIVLFKGEIEQRAYVNAESQTPVMQARAMYRRARRYRKWYRKPRFQNRKRKDAKCKACGKNAPSGRALCRPCQTKQHHQRHHPKKSLIWLPPTVKAKAELHLRIVHVLNKFLPLTLVVVETVSFDLQKLVQPEVEGKDYQQGKQKGFENVKMYVRFRDRYRCQLCEKKALRLEVHHITPRSKQGSNRPENLVVLCQRCHKKITGKEETVACQLRKRIASKAQPLAKTAQVNSFKEYILVKLDLPHEETFGYLTKGRRERLGLEKSHANDAIACAVRERKTRLVDKSVENKSTSVRRTVRQQYKANAQKRKGRLRYRQKWNEREGIGRGDVCWHNKKQCRVRIDTLLSTGKFSGKQLKSSKRIVSILPCHLQLLHKKKSVSF